MYAALKGKGLELVAINQGDSKATINKYVKEGKFTFPIAMGGSGSDKNYDVFTQYGVQAYPTNYVVDSKGRVAFRAVGFDEAGMRAALEKLGVK